MSDRIGSESHYPFEFKGKGGEYFKIWIVNVLLSVLTMYVYSAWAKVRTNRYFYGNTYVNNSAFEYHAKPIQILKGRIIAVIAFIIYVIAQTINPVAGLALLILILLITPWVICRSLKFKARMSSHRNVQFGFTGTSGPLYVYILLVPFLPLIIGGLLIGAMYFMDLEMGLDTSALPLIIGFSVVGFYLMVPLVQSLLTRYQLNHSQYGNGKFDIKIGVWRYYAVYLRAFLWSLLAIAIVIGTFAGLFSIFSERLKIRSTEDLPAAVEKMLETSLLGNFSNDTLTLIAGVLSYALLIFAGFLLTAYLRSKIRNYVYNNTRVDNRVALRSTFRTFPFFRLKLSNILIIIFTLGLGYPWTKVRTARYAANNTSLIAKDSLDGFVSEQTQYQSSLAEEMGDAFDLDLDLGM